MLTIRMQRSGRTGHAQFRVIVQDRRAHPTSGRVVAYVGSYNPHTKAASLDKEKLETFLGNGAVPSDRAARLLAKEGVKLPSWYKASPQKKKAVRNTEKRRSTATETPKDEAPKTEEPNKDVPTEAAPEQPAENTETAVDAPAGEKPAEDPEEQPAEETPAETDSPVEEPASEPVEEKPAE